ncbi:hypothetical protein RB653_004049 [Dictyostelium firmibasis]|uniref:Uncharacterized protein n=1 Tax=Dictyostelium firmibasis TaxID=79012 RepID=A0AAN7TYZ8_9MYCE
MSSQEQKKSEQKQAQEGVDGVWLDKYSTLSRVYNYGFVNGSIEKGKEWYNYIKDSNSYVKSTLEYGENGVVAVGKPILSQLEQYDSIVKKVDEYGNSGLDILEKKVESIKGTSENLANKADCAADGLISASANYTPNVVINLVQKTNGMIDSLIESLLPPKDDDKVNEISDEEKFQLEKRMKFLLKLRKRLNTQTILEIPSNSIHLVTGYSGKSYSQAMDMICQLSNSVSKITTNSKFSQVFIDQIYLTVDNLVGQVAALSVWFKDINISETLISLGELSKMVNESKNHVLELTDPQERVEKLKHDFSLILKSCLDVLHNQMEGGKDKLESFKGVVSNHQYFVAAFSMLEDALNKLSLSLKNYSNNLEEKKSNDNSTSSNNNSTN